MFMYGGCTQALCSDPREHHVDFEMGVIQAPSLLISATQTFNVLVFRIGVHMSFSNVCCSLYRLFWQLH